MYLTLYLDPEKEERSTYYICVLVQLELSSVLSQDCRLHSRSNAILDLIVNLNLFVPQRFMILGSVGQWWNL